MRRLFLHIAYDGTDFHGWQDQPGMRSVQGVLQESARRVVRHPLRIVGSGRTDAGVHAAGQIAHLDTDCAIPADKLRYAIGSRLPEDLSVVAVADVHPEFHAQHRSLSKLYRYRIVHSRRRPVDRLIQRYACHIWQALDVEAMREASRYFVGTHDFAAMAASSGISRKTTVRTVLRCEVERHFEEIRVDVEGTGFLYNQVRTMVGALTKIGRGQWPAQIIPELLAGKSRDHGGPTAPANGLCLQWVRYPAELLTPPDVPPQDGGGATEGAGEGAAGP